MCAIGTVHAFPQRMFNTAACNQLDLILHCRSISGFFGLYFSVNLWRTHANHKLPVCIKICFCCVHLGPNFTNEQGRETSLYGLVIKPGTERNVLFWYISCTLLQLNIMCMISEHSRSSSDSCTLPHRWRTTTAMDFPHLKKQQLSND